LGVLIGAKANALSCVVAIAESANLAGQKPFSWAGFSENWHREMNSAFKEAANYGGGTRFPVLPHYLTARNENDRRIQAYERLGFNFSQLEEGVVGIPELKIAIKNFRQKRDLWIGKGALTWEESLDPGVLVINRKGEIKTLPFGEDPQEECFLVDVSARPYLFTAMLAHGIFPISDSMRAHHDFSHLRGMWEHPEFMKGIRKLAYSYHKKETSIPLRHRYVRLFHAYESMALVPNSYREKLASYLDPLFENSQSRVTVAILADKLLKLPERELVTQGNRLVQFATHQIIYFGGTGEIGVHYNNVEVKDSIEAMTRRLRKAVTVSERAITLGNDDGKPFQKMGNRDTLVVNLARMQIALWHASQISIEDYFNGLADSEFKTNNPLYQMYVASGLGSPRNSDPNEFSGSLLSLSLSNQLSEEHDRLFSSHYGLAVSRK
jgi:hypothetical protein